MCMQLEAGNEVTGAATCVARGSKPRDRSVERAKRMPFFMKAARHVARAGQTSPRQQLRLVDDLLPCQFRPSDWFFAVRCDCAAAASILASAMGQITCYRCLKCNVICFSSLFLIGGSGLLGASLWLLGKVNSIQQMVSRSSNSVGIHLMVASAVILIVAGISGCIGALREGRCLLSTTIVLLAAAFALGCSGGLWTYATASRNERMFADRIKQIVRHDYGTETMKTAILDVVQQSFQCCGSDDVSSWASSLYSQTENQKWLPSSPSVAFTVPESCCLNPSSNICANSRHILQLNGSPRVDDTVIFTKGCLTQVTASSIPYGIYALAMSLSACLLEFLAIVTSTLLWRSLRFSIS